MWRKLRQIVVPRGAAAERGQSGQSLIILAFAFMALVAIIGLAIDLGMMYIERIRLGSACDAASLAGAQELPYEEQAALRAIEYLEENGYSMQEVGLTVIGPTDAEQLSHPIPPGGRGTFQVRAHTRADPDQSEPTDMLSVSGTISVPMSFMVLLGFDEVAVNAHAMAENVLNRLDVAIVYDKSGSMNDDTYCFQCMHNNPNRPPPPECYGCYIEDPEEGYPAGARLELPTPQEYCGASQPLNHGGYQILVAEAEWYSSSTSVPEDAPPVYDRSTYEQGDTFWMLQRVAGSQASGNQYEQGDQRGAHLMHMPNLDWMPGHRSTELSSAPRLDYQIDLPSYGRWYVWVRAQCGAWPGDAERVDGCVLHWGTNGAYVGSTEQNSFGADGDLIADGDLCWCASGDCGICRPPREGGSRGNRWTWVRLGDFTDDGQVQINLWGGGLGFRLDKLLLTTNPEGPSNASADRAPAFIRETTPTWNEVASNPFPGYQSYVANGRYGGPFDTGGRNGMACDPCNPIYGSQCGQAYDDTFDDAQPIRAAQEAAKSFVQRMRARFDQVAFVEYSDRSLITSELECVWDRGVPPVDLGLGTYPDDAWTWCYDNGAGSIVDAIDSMVPLGSTNIAQGIQDGIQVLQPIGGHYGRPYALRYIIVMTDGVPNRWPNYRGNFEADPQWDHVCNADDLWPIEGYEEEPGTEEEARARDCAIYYANQAKDDGIAIFTIGLGVNVDHALLTAMAHKMPDSNQPDGEYFPVTNEEELRAAFEEIADKMVLRLVE